MCEKKIKLTSTVVNMQPCTVGIATTLLATWQKGHSWNVLAEQALGNGRGDKFALNYALVAAIQSIGSGGSAGDKKLAHLNMAGTNNFFLTYQKLEKRIGEIQINIQNKFIDSGFQEEKLKTNRNLESIDDASKNDEIVPLSVSYGRNVK